MTQDVLAAALENTTKLVGVTSRQTLGVLAARDLERFVVAIGSGAKAAVDATGAVVAHPLYLTAVLGWGAGPATEQLRPDGTEFLDTDRLPVEGLRLMGGGQELEFFAAPTEGMEVQVETTLRHVELKQGRTGALLLMRIERRYTSAEGTLLSVCTETLMAR